MLLATLLLHPNEVVTIERIVEGVWGAGRPDSAAHLVQVYVLHLRRALRPVGLDERLSTEATG